MCDVSAQSCLDVAHATRFLRAVYLDVPGWLNIVSSGDWRGRCFPTDEAGISAAARYAQDLDAARGPRGIYFRATTLRQVPASGRGLTDHTLSVPMLWADVDYGTEGHHCSTLPPDAAAAKAMIAESGLPAPTLMVNSGGGLYPLWLLTQRLPLERAAALSEDVQHALADAHQRHGHTYGAGVGDLARVLRLPGSINRKTDAPRACQVSAASGVLLDPAAFPSRPPPPRPSSPAPTHATRTATVNPRHGPFDVLDRHAQWADIFTPAGWTFVKTENSGAQLWLRPGGCTSAYSARCFAHNVVVHSEGAGLPTGAGQRLTRGRVFAHLWHDGHETAAARDLIAAAHGQPCTPAAAALPHPVLASIRDSAPAQVERRRDSPIDDANLASTSELQSWLVTFTGNHQPARLTRRLAWMCADPTDRLRHHAHQLVSESIEGHYPAGAATAALTAAYRHHGSNDPQAPTQLLALALGTVLAALQAAPP